VRHSRLSILAFTAVLGGSAALADDLNLGSNYVPVYINEAGVGATNVGGGPITVSYLNGSQLAYVYCVGFFTDVYVPGDYNATTVTNNGTADGVTDNNNSQVVAVNNAGEIAWLLDTFAGAAAVAGAGGDQTQEQALQAAIWSVEYNGTGTAAGDPVLTGLAGQGYYGQYLADLSALGSNTADVATVDWFSPTISGSSTVYQALVGPNAAVPEPASILLLGTLLLFFAISTSRKKLGAGR
jgi:hypothetical protein